MGEWLGGRNLNGDERLNLLPLDRLAAVRVRVLRCCERWQLQVCGAYPDTSHLPISTVISTDLGGVGVGVRSRRRSCILAAVGNQLLYPHGGALGQPDMHDVGGQQAIGNHAAGAYQRIVRLAHAHAQTL